MIYTREALRIHAALLKLAFPLLIATWRGDEARQGHILAQAIVLRQRRDDLWKELRR